MDQTNLDIYGHPPIPWSRAERQLEAPVADSVRHFLATVRPDGRPHVAGIGALWVDGKFYFVSGPGTRKSRNLAERPECVISVTLPDLDQGDRPGDARTTGRTLCRAGLAGDRRRRRVHRPYSAPSAGPPPWDLYEFTPRTAFGVAGAEPHGATRWRFKT